MEIVNNVKQFLTKKLILRRPTAEAIHNYLAHGNCERLLQLAQAISIFLVL
jgi:hypothetical protein